MKQTQYLKSKEVQEHWRHREEGAGTELRAALFMLPPRGCNWRAGWKCEFMGPLPPPESEIPGMGPAVSLNRRTAMPVEVGATERQEFPQETQPLLRYNIGEGTVSSKNRAVFRGREGGGEGTALTREIDSRQPCPAVLRDQGSPLAPRVVTAWPRRMEDMSGKGKAISTGFQDPMR